VDMLERLLAAFDHSDWPLYLGRMRVTGFVLPAGRTDCTFVSQSFVLSIMVINLVVQCFAGFIYLGPRVDAMDVDYAHYCCSGCRRRRKLLLGSIFL